MPETNGNGNGRTLELGKLIGTLEAFGKGQEALSKDLGDVQTLVGDVKEKVALSEKGIADNQEDINGLGKKVEGLRMGQEKWFEEKTKEIKTSIRNYTIIITTVLGLFMTFLGLWMRTSSKPTEIILKAPDGTVIMENTDATSGGGHN